MDFILSRSASRILRTAVCITLVNIASFQSCRAGLADHCFASQGSQRKAPEMWAAARCCSLKLNTNPSTDISLSIQWPKEETTRDMEKGNRNPVNDASYMPGFSYLNFASSVFHHDRCSIRVSTARLLAAQEVALGSAK